MHVSYGYGYERRRLQRKEEKAFRTSTLLGEKEGSMYGVEELDVSMVCLEREM